MPSTWTTEQILALAPDASSQKAGRALASPVKWKSLGTSEQAVWGECRGSGKDPYQTQIDLSEPAFRCSCPSRKFPCKHALALFLLYAGQSPLFSGAVPPSWVTDWLESRAKRSQQKAERAAKAEGNGKPVDVEAQAKRASAREKKIAAGLLDLEVWLRDLVRGGLGAVQSQGYGYWETPAARLVDAQAPGLARLVRDLAGIPVSGDGWQERLLERLGRLHLLVRGYQRLESLPADLQADLRSLIGWTTSQEEVLAQDGVRDSWLVVGQRVEAEDRLQVQRTWLWGRWSERRALVLHFAPFGQPLDHSLVPGMSLEASLVFYPSAYPLRALVKERYGDVQPDGVMRGFPTLMQAWQTYSECLAIQPWLETFPFPLDAVTPVLRDGRWAVRDVEGHELRLARQFEQGWRLLAISGGEPVPLFGEWDGDALLPLSVQSGEGFVSLVDVPA